MFQIYFGEEIWTEISQHLWSQQEPENTEGNYFDRVPSPVGVLGSQPETTAAENKRINDWIVALSQVGFHIFADWS